MMSCRWIWLGVVASLVPGSLPAAEEKVEIRVVPAELPPPAVEIRKAARAAVRVKALKAMEEAAAVAAEEAAEEEAAGAGAESESEAGETVITAPSEPMPPLFQLRDGSRIAGEPDTTTLEIDTAYGRLLVPIEDIVRIRFVREPEAGLAEKIAATVERLGSDDYDEREAATAELRKIGLPALDALKVAAKSEDEEVRTRAEALVAEVGEEIEAAEEDDPGSAPLQGEDDEIVTRRFTIRGKVVKPTYLVKSKYGEFKVSRADIVSVTFVRGGGLHLQVKIPATAMAAQTWVDTKADVTKGARLKIKASGTINVEAYGENATPDGSRRIGNRFMNFPACALVGKIGRNGTPFLVGSDYDDASEEAGRLYLAIAAQPMGNVTGEYKARIDVEPAE
ncbi:MAG: hypothetical protein JXP34_25735 [Planctomycetes bacterium]|nr:hypothetical protein [Planctomycetota bacterium]